ncbi:amino acid adenylation domain-containing protein [Microbulbifer discodermiae]|uniref:amino acid adenylation domain-containing protein n=1 Tax=Microbulbifer sp. 2201CG32-9 TaxID=3232309 RepID=UPI00345B8E07
MAVSPEISLVQSLISKGVYLYVENDELKFRAKKGALNEEDKLAVRQHKQAIICYLSSLESDSSPSLTPPPLKAGDSPPDRLPLSFSQQRLWFIHKLEPNSTQFNMHSRFMLSGEADPEAMQEAIAALMERQAILRTCYCEDNTGVYQHILTDPEVPLSVEDLREQGIERASEFIFQIGEQERQKNFDLAQRPPIRVRLLQLPMQKTCVLYTLHHIACDGWSLGIFERELIQLYNAFHTESRASLATLPLQYADYAEWQRGWLKGSVLQHLCGYWREQLNGMPSVHQLPLDFQRPAQQDFNGAVLSLSMDVGIVAPLRAVCREYRVTPFILLYSVFSVFVARWSQQDDVVIGTPIAGRSSAELEGLIGFFVNTLVLRSSIDDCEDFASLLERNRQTILTAYEHQYLPFEKLVEEINPERSLSYSALVQLSFGVQDLAGENIVEKSLTMPADSRLNLPFELKLDIRCGDDGILLDWFYRSSLFSEATIRNMGESFQYLLMSLVDQLCRRERYPLGSLPLLQAGACQELKDLGRGNPASERRYLPVHQRIATVAAQTPDKVAVTTPESELSYGDLEAQSNQLAHYLAARGVGAEALIAIQLPRGPQLVIALLAVMKSGAAYVPLDAKAPEHRLIQILEDCRPLLILTTKAWQESLPQDFDRVVVDDSATASEIVDSSCYPVESLTCVYQPSCAMYLIYTSGSTGVPKGATVSYASVAEFVDQGIEEFVPAHIGSAVVSSPLAFDATVGSLWVGLAAGCGIHLISETVEALDDLSAHFDGDSARLFKITPSHLEALYAHGKLTGNSRVAHVVVVAGETLYGGLLCQWQQLYPSARFINEYGPTEATVGSTIYPCTPVATLGVGASVPIGSALGDTQLYVLNSQLQFQPQGAVGELYIGGAGLARGYHRRPALTAERFVPSPFGEGSGERLYRTGDLVRWLAGGGLEFIGRADLQVKIRGFRIELGEIEAAFKSMDSISEAAVTTRLDGQQVPQIVAYVVARQTGEERESESNLKIQWFEQLKRQLPPFMLPAAIVVLDAMPLTANDKVNRRALPALSAADFQQCVYRAPQTTTEEFLCQLWQELLNRQRIGIDDNFFALGGHSLLATQVISRIRQKFAVELPLRCIFESPTIVGLARHIELGDSRQALPELLPADRSKPLQLSFSQSRLWFVDRIGEGSVQYNMPGYYLIEGDFDQTAFERALNGVLERHEVLRSVIREHNGEPVQAIVAGAKLPLRLIDLTAEADTERRWQQARDLIVEEGQIPFDLSSDILLRVLLVRMSATAHIMAYTLHHIAGDGISKAILQRDFVTLYDAHRKGLPAILPDLRVQYADYALWQRQCLQGDRLEASLDYWVEQLQELPLLHQLPLDRQRPSRQRHKGQSFSTRVEGELSAKVKQLCQRHQCSVFMFMHAALKVLISRYSGERDIVVGSAITGRNHQYLENLIGFFVNDLVLRATVDPEQGFESFLRTERETILAAYQHQWIPFEMLVETLNPERSLSHSPLFQIKLDERNPAEAKAQSGGLAITNLGSSSSPNEAEVSAEHHVKHDLYVSVAVEEDALSIYWLFNSDIFNAATMVDFARNFHTLVASIVADPTRSIKALNILQPGQKDRLMEAARGPSKSTPSLESSLLHPLSEWGERTAACDADGQLSFAELNSKSNRLAQFLAASGVGTESTLGLCFEPCADSLIAILAVWKAGAAYLPLDPLTPESRMQEILDDSGITLVLTQAHLVEDLYIEGARLLPVDGAMGSRLMGGHEDRAPANTARGDNLAYSIYTSGSTGTAKGVMVSRDALARYCDFAVATYYRDHLEGALVASAMHFDLTIPCLVLPLMRGDCVNFLPPGADMALLAKTLTETDKHFLLRLTPSHIMAVLPFLTEGRCQNRHVFVIGGEPFSPSLYQRLQHLFPAAEIFNHYGPTETVIGCSMQALAHEWGDDRDTCPIGGPMGSTQLYVLDGELQPVAPGIAGELYIGGERLARGYRARGGLTAERFVCHPFADRPGERLYRTGDAVRWCSDGGGRPLWLEFIGRMDRQVKVRGHRIELAEIERRLLLLEGVCECAVDVRAAPSGELHLVAYLAMQTDITADAEDEGEIIQRKQRVIQHLRKSLSVQLPDYMVPYVYIFMPGLPRTSNGKLDRAALPSPEEGDLIKSRYAAPKSEVEKQLCGIWQHVLKLQKIGIDDDFFLLGGHSLLATQVVNMIREQFSVEIPLATLFEKATIRVLAAEVTAYIIKTRSLESGAAEGKEEDLEEVILE